MTSEDELKQFMSGLERRNPGEPEFHQAVQEVAKDILPFEGGGRAAGYFTSASGLTIYRGDALPKEFFEEVHAAFAVKREKFRFVFFIYLFSAGHYDLPPSSSTLEEKRTQSPVS